MQRLRKQQPLERAAGILLPISSLPSPYGIGTLGSSAYAFIDFLHGAGQRYWQVLPVGPTSYGDSPYQSFSAFAGNPYFIDLDLLVEEGVLDKKTIESEDWGDDPERIDYAKLYSARFRVLRQAFDKWQPKGSDYEAFVAKHAHWLEDYCLYMAIKLEQGGKSWLEWPEELRMGDNLALDRWRGEHETDIEFWKFCQYQFMVQWKALQAYAHERHVKIIGDIPIYVALDSADVWRKSEYFLLDAMRRPTAVAGVPPDLFSATGQLWGNPLYDWETLRQEEYSWWKARMQHCALLFDLIRIDHFIGIVRYYAIPYGAETAMVGEYRKGPGEELLQAIATVLGESKIIAEDLGLVVPSVRRLLKRSGYPGMKIMEFAFSSGPANENLPCHYDKNVVVYGGTHDNETLAGYFSKRRGEELRYAKQYLRVKTKAALPGAIIREAMASCANTAIFQMQDYLELGNEARMNFPSTMGENWRWRMKEGALTDELAASILELTQIYGRALAE